MLYSTFGCPVIAPNLGWFPEIFDKYPIGILYDNTQSDGILDALNTSLQCKREDYQNSLQAFCSAWSLQEATRATLEVYERIA
jgi:glycosyltransferase involved in cell wall biosynthesis